MNITFLKTEVNLIERDLAPFSTTPQRKDPEMSNRGDLENESTLFASLVKLRFVDDLMWLSTKPRSCENL